MSKRIFRNQSAPVCCSCKESKEPSSMLDGGDLELFQQLISSSFRAEILLGKAAAILNLEDVENCDIVEEIPAVMSELYLHYLRISALMVCLEDVRPLPEVAETLSTAKDVRSSVEEMLAVMSGVFGQTFDISDADYDKEEFGSDAACDIQMVFSGDIDKDTANQISALTAKYVNDLLADYFDSNSGDSGEETADESEGKGNIVLDLEQISADDLCRLQRAVIQELDRRSNPS